MAASTGAAPRHLPGDSGTGSLSLHTLSDALALRSRLGGLTRATAAFLATEEARHSARAGLQGYSSTHFGVTLQGIGTPSIADEIRCDGDYRAEGWAGSRFFREGRLCAAVAYGRPAYVLRALPELLEAAAS